MNLFTFDCFIVISQTTVVSVVVVLYFLCFHSISPHHPRVTILQLSLGQMYQNFHSSQSAFFPMWKVKISNFSFSYSPNIINGGWYNKTREEKGILGSWGSKIKTLRKLKNLHVLSHGSVSSSSCYG